MEQALIILLVLTILVMSFTAPKLLSWILIIGAFFGITAASVYANGFPEGLIGGMAMGGFVAFLGWLRFRKSFAETARAREQLKDRLSQGKYSTCEVCGSKKLTYHRTPKNIGQLLLGGLTCENCGAEIDVLFDVFMPR